MPQVFSPPVLRPCGDRAVLMELGDAIDPAVNRLVGRALEALDQHRPDWLVEAVGAYRSLMVIYDPLRADYQQVSRHLAALELAQAAGRREDGGVVEIPVCYGGEFGPDLEMVARHNRLSARQVVELHSAVAYHVYMMGFTPGFPYLGGLDPRLHTPRLESPRTTVAAGSVGIANDQTGIYPVASPGGWRIIGRTPRKLFDPRRDDPFLLRAGRRLRFVPISQDEYRRLVAEG